MPCCVTGCSGSARLVQFPSDGTLQRRWCDAIELATGTGLTMVEEQSLELCEDHFETDSNPADQRYREPVRFTDRTGQSVELGSCRLCHRIEVAFRLYSLSKPMAADVTIGTVLSESIKVQLEGGDNMRFICGVCLAQVGMVLTIQKSFLIKGDPGAEHTERTDPLTEVTCCRLCHRYEPTAQMCFLDDELAEGVTIGSTLNTILQSEFDLMQLICLDCLAKIDLMRSIQSFFAGKDNNFRSWQREDMVTVDSDCNPELMLEVKVEPVEIQETAEESRKRRPKRTGSKMVTENKQFECKICNKNYPYSGCPHCPSLQLLRFACDTCGREFGKKILLEKHVRAMHSEPGTTKRYSCSQCDKTFRLYSTYHRHKETHTGTKRYACTVCDRKFSQSSSLGRHIRNVHTLEKSYRCEDCGDSLRSSAAFNKHRTEFHPPKAAVEEKASCPICLEESPTKLLLQQHVKSVHEERKAFGCLECGKVYINFANLKRHRDTHNEKRKHPCEFCDKSFTQQISLKNHIRNRHTGEAAFVCADCGETFKDSSAFYKHRANQHAEVGQAFPCESCGEQFEQKAHLIKHRRSAHPELSQFVCPECGKLFSSSSTLNRHQETHSGTRKYRCSFCAQSFSQRTLLKNHIRNRHTGETPFGCDNCGEAFRDSSVFYKHRAKCRKEVVEVKVEPADLLGDDS